MNPRLQTLRRPRRLDARGFTMMETLVALIVVAVGVFSLTALIPAGARSNSKSGKETRGSELAAQTVERLLSTPFNGTELDEGSHQDTTWPYPGGYYVTWEVELNQPIQSCKRVTVTVRWPTASSNTLTRLVAVTPRANDENLSIVGN